MSVYENLTKRIETEKRSALDCYQSEAKVLIPLFTNEAIALEKVRDSMLIEEAILEL